MPIRPEIPLPDLLPMIILLLIHPHLAPRLDAPLRFAPRQVLALARSLVPRTVLQPFVGAAEVLRVGRGVFFQFVVPDEVGAVVAGGFGNVAAGWWGKGGLLGVIFFYGWVGWGRADGGVRDHDGVMPRVEICARGIRRCTRRRDGVLGSARTGILPWLWICKAFFSPSDSWGWGAAAAASTIGCC